MADRLDLKQLERKAWTSFFEDGLLDIFMGLVLLAVGIPAALPGIFTSELSQDVGAALLMVLAFLPYWAGKRFITVPRAGRAEFGRERRSRQTRVALLYSISVVVGVIVLLMGMLRLSSIRPAWVERLGVEGFFALALGGWMFLILGLASYFMQYTRGYVIAALYAVAFGGSVIVHNPITFVGAGTLGVVMGLAVFVRFVQTHPKPSERETGSRYDAAGC